MEEKRKARKDGFADVLLSRLADFQEHFQAFTGKLQALNDDRQTNQHILGICGFHSIILRILDANLSDADLALLDSDAPFPEDACQQPKKGCSRHGEWGTYRQDEIDGEVDALVAEIKGLKTEEEKLLTRMERRMEVLVRLLSISERETGPRSLTYAVSRYSLRRTCLELSGNWMR